MRLLGAATPEELRSAEIAAVSVSLGAGLLVGALMQAFRAQPLTAAFSTGAAIAIASVVLMRR